MHRNAGHFRGYGDDLANWIVPGRRVAGIGGAMELAQKAKKVVVLMNHVNRQGVSKIKKQRALPLTAQECVDLIITDMAVMEVTDTLEDVVRHTEAALKIPEHIVYISSCWE